MKYFIRQKSGPAFLALTLSILISINLHAQLKPTPHLGEGPFYPPDDSKDIGNDLTAVDGSTGIPKGQIIYIIGTVKNTEGQPLAGAQVIIWQTDEVGKYNHPRENRYTRDGKKLSLDPNFQYWGKTVTDENGNYRFKTILPGHYGGRPNHIHYKIRHPDYRVLTTELHFKGDPKLDGDFVTDGLSENQLSLLDVELKDPPEGFDDPNYQVGRFDIVLKK